MIQSPHAPCTASINFMSPPTISSLPYRGRQSTILVKGPLCWHHRTFLMWDLIMHSCPLGLVCCTVFRVDFGEGNRSEKEVFLRYTITLGTTGSKGLVCNRKGPICNNRMIEINYVPQIVFSVV
jgi:hypothetical protein